MSDGLEKRPLEELLDQLEKHLPNIAMERARKHITTLRELLVNARTPRVAIVGRRGAGKSSLINAFFGQPVAETGAVLATTPGGTWYAYKGERGSLEVLDTRGFGDGTRPEGAAEGDVLAENRYAVQQYYPDAILLVVRAGDVDSWIQKDLELVRSLRQAVQKQHGYEPPVIGVVTHVDTLSPSHISEPPFAHPVKQQHIETARSYLAKLLEERLEQPVAVFAVCCYMWWNEEGLLEADRRWNVEELASFLMDHLPHNARVKAARLMGVKQAQRKLANVIVQAVTGLAGVAGGTPIPAADMPIITGLQLSMVTAVAYVAGTRATKATVVKFLGALGVNVGAGYVFREVARGLIKLLPVAGGAISAGVAASGTYAVGQAAIAYFIDGAGNEVARQVLKQAQQEAEEAAPALEKQQP